LGRRKKRWEREDIFGGVMWWRKMKEKRKRMSRGKN